MTNDPLGYYEILGVGFDAGEKEIKQSYRDRAKLWHPDSNTDEDSMEKFQKLSVAYDVIKDDKSRLTYDLLAQAYSSVDFPDMFSLKVYTNQKGREDLGVRALRLRKIIGKFVKSSYENNKIICNYKESRKIVFKNSLSNWLLGWWSLDALFKTPKIIIGNFMKIDKNTHDNLSLLIHNSLAYVQDVKKKEAYLSAVQALKYADPYQKKLLNKFILFLDVKEPQKSYKWNYATLRLLQLIIPSILLIILMSASANRYITAGEYRQRFSDRTNMNYYQKVKFRGGGEIIDDQIVSKVLNIPVDFGDLNMLYHIAEDTKVMYGPSDKFDVLTELSLGHTVRLTGHTPDNVWSRVMIDNGETGFVKTGILKKGMGRTIPADSKIYTGPR